MLELWCMLLFGLIVELKFEICSHRVLQGQVWSSKNPQKYGANLKRNTANFKTYPMFFLIVWSCQIHKLEIEPKVHLHTTIVSVVVGRTLFYLVLISGDNEGYKCIDDCNYYYKLLYLVQLCLQDVVVGTKSCDRCLTIVVYLILFSL